MSNNRVTLSEVAVSIREVRETIEEGQGELSLEQIRVFDDICTAVGFGKKWRRIILGQKAWERLEQPVALKEWTACPPPTEAEQLLLQGMPEEVAPVNYHYAGV
jgi:hypothetical protein